MVVGPPGHGAAQHPVAGGGHRPLAPGDLHVVAAHETARKVGFIELLAQDAAAAGSEARVDIALEHPLNQPPGMQHQVLADQPGAVGQAVGKARRTRIEQQARGAHAVAREHHHFGALAALHALRVVVDDAGGHVVVIDQNFAYPAAGAQLDAGAPGHRPVGDVGAALGAFGAARPAGPQVAAGLAPLVVAGDDGAVRGPPVPAQTVETAPHGLAHTPQRHWRQGWFVRRNGGVAGQARHPDHAIVQGKEGRECGVVDRPVVGHAVERAHLEIGRMKAREVG